MGRIPVESRACAVCLNGVVVELMDAATRWIEAVSSRRAADDISSGRSGKCMVTLRRKGARQQNSPQ